MQRVIREVFIERADRDLPNRFTTLDKVEICIRRRIRGGRVKEDIIYRGDCPLSGIRSCDFNSRLYYRECIILLLYL